MDILQKTQLSHKFDADFVEAVFCAAARFRPDHDLYRDWLEGEMKNRIVVGNCRYERPRFIDPDQDAVLPPGWFNGFEFRSTSLDVWRSGLRNKGKAFWCTKNGDLVPDILNYAMFLDMNTDKWGDRLRARTEAALAVIRLVDGREGLIPGYHETILDQSIHGLELSGAAKYPRRRE